MNKLPFFKEAFYLFGGVVFLAVLGLQIKIQTQEIVINNYRLACLEDYAGSAFHRETHADKRSHAHSKCIHGY